MFQTCRKHVRKHKESKSNFGLDSRKNETVSFLIMKLRFVLRFFLQIGLRKQEKEQISCENNGAMEL